MERASGRGNAESQTSVDLHGLVSIHSSVMALAISTTQGERENVPYDQRNADHMDGNVDFIAMICTIER